MINKKLEYKTFYMQNDNLFYICQKKRVCNLIHKIQKKINIYQDYIRKMELVLREDQRQFKKPLADIPIVQYLIVEKWKSEE